MKLMKYLLFFNVLPAFRQTSMYTQNTHRLFAGLQLLLGAGKLVPQPRVLLAEPPDLCPQLLLLRLDHLQVAGQCQHDLGLAQPELDHLDVLGDEAGLVAGRRRFLRLQPIQETGVLDPQGIQTLDDRARTGHYLLLRHGRHSTDVLDFFAATKRFIFRLV